MTIGFRVLGPLEVSVDDIPVALPARQQRVLLSALLIHAGQVVSTDRLIDMVWGEVPPATARAALQNVVAELRKLLAPGGDPLTTRPPGYVLSTVGCRYDLREFEDALARGRSALAGQDFAAAAEDLRGALSLWRGRPLDDVVYESFAAPAVARLEELRLMALESRVDADLALGRHTELVGELRELVAEEPLREAVRGQLMLALYRCGRQADALEVYREWRLRLADELGLDPGPALQRLEGAILRRDPSLDAPTADLPGDPVGRGVRRSVLLAAGDQPSFDALIEMAVPLVRVAPTRDLILLWVVATAGSLETDRNALSLAGHHLARHQSMLDGEGMQSRTAACVADDAIAAAGRIARYEDVDLILAAARPANGGEALCDVASLVNTQRMGSGSVLVPFGAADEEWSALELGAWMAASHDCELRLAGAAEASGLLATASLIVQRATGVHVEPLLVEPGPDGMLAAAAGCSMMVLGLPDDGHGLGVERSRIAAEVGIPVLAVRGGARPGGMAPRESLTRFRWSIGGAAT